MVPTFTFELNSLEDTQWLAHFLAQRLPDGTTVALEGTLGAGKSQLVRFVAASLEIDPDSVTSPTFTLWNTYHGKRTIHHLDAYRLESEDEFWEIGGEELFEEEGIIFIEWASKIPSALPDQRIDLEIEVLGETKRKVTVKNSLAEEIDFTAFEKP